MKPAQWIPGALLVGALAVAAVACNSITGLNDYEKVDCVGACGDAGLDAPPDTTPDVIDDARHEDVLEASGDWDADAFIEAGTDADADVDAPDDAPNDVNFDAAEVGSIDRASRWARWLMPHEDTSLAPDSGNPPGPTPSLGYQDVGSDYFRDLVTKVLWTRTYSTQLTLGDAVGYCDALSDPPLKMRLPTRIELVSLLEPTRSPPYNAALSDVQPGAYWSLSNAPQRDAAADIEYWVVDFASGEVRTLGDNGTKLYVRCVVEQEEP